MTAARRPGRHRATSRWKMAALSVAIDITLTAAVLCAAFVLWLVWWTDVQASHAQQQAVAEFRQQATERLSPAVEQPEPATPADEPDPQEPRRPEYGEVFGILRVPRWGKEYQVPIASGSGRDVLDLGYVAHYDTTAMPGQVGNFAISAHRLSYGAPFRNIEQLVSGDTVVVETADRVYTYEVTDHYVVTPDRVDVIAPVPGRPGAEPTEKILTMTTCHPLYYDHERWITHAVLVDEEPAPA